MRIDIAENLPTIEELYASVKAAETEAHRVAREAIEAMGKAQRRAKRMDAQLDGDEAAWTIEMLRDMVAIRKAAAEAEEHLLRRAIQTGALHPRTAAEITGLSVDDIWAIAR
ncbi:hypothetical protein GCM10025867_46370 (plasmid) [Frondihabitans sucicola]|uniref:DUF222 domain-containing protein n=1 Tax=Frondihabitans sucicola TaxID=1268041 RepID=A0ABN6Y8T6_9MICO|nr:hypothetical protein [Frondihabitans sucicola]BDZ52396.1 hypothetical protein GCM10025867_46370 [Frondihabitans sucicola]